MAKTIRALARFPSGAKFETVITPHGDVTERERTLITGAVALFTAHQVFSEKLDLNSPYMSLARDMLDVLPVERVIVNGVQFFPPDDSAPRKIGYKERFRANYPDECEESRRIMQATRADDDAMNTLFDYLENRTPDIDPKFIPTLLRCGAVYREGDEIKVSRGLALNTLAIALDCESEPMCQRCRGISQKLQSLGFSLD